MTREEVIRGLECCLKDDCDNCPYYDPEVDHDCDYFGKCLRGNMYHDAIALLKEQEPRVMTLWEAVGIIDRPVYLERNVLMPDKSVNRQECWALVCATDDEHMIRLATPYGEEKWHVGAYGIGWRCWTSRPTDEQREAIPWE